MHQVILELQSRSRDENIFILRTALEGLKWERLTKVTESSIKIIDSIRA